MNEADPEVQPTALLGCVAIATASLTNKVAALEFTTPLSTQRNWLLLSDKVTPDKDNVAVSALA